MIIFVRLSGLFDNDLKIVCTALLPELHVRAAQTNFQLMQLAHLTSAPFLLSFVWVYVVADITNYEKVIS